MGRRTQRPCLEETVARNSRDRSFLAKGEGRPMTRQSETRRDLGLAAQALREEVHFAKLGDSIGLWKGAQIALAVGLALNDFFFALGKECGTDPFAPETEFYDLCTEIADRFDERRRELEAAADDDARMSRGCWKYHQGADQ